MFSVGVRFYLVDKTFELAIMMFKYLKETMSNVLKIVSVALQLENINTEVETIINNEVKILELKISSKKMKTIEGQNRKV